MSETTQETLERVGLIPVLRAKNAAQARAVVEAMIAGGVTVVEVTMTVPGAVDLLKELKKEYGSTAPARLRHRHHRRPVPGHHRRRRGVCRQPQPAPRSHQHNEKERQSLLSRRAYAHRGHHRLECGCRLRQNLSLLSSGRRILPQVASSPVPASQDHSHGRRDAGNGREFSVRGRKGPRRRQRPGKPGRRRCRTS